MRADVAVIGAGVFGAWTAWHLRRAGLSVALLDGYGPANARASSGGESRIIRAGYGPREIYTRWSIRSLDLWRGWIARTDPTLYQPCGALWIAAPDDAFAEETASTLQRCDVTFERLGSRDLAARFPQFAFPQDAWGIFEPAAGALMARRAVQTLVRSMLGGGLQYFHTTAHLEGGIVKTAEGETVSARHFVFACGPWLSKVFPEVVGRRIVTSRQEVYFFGTPPGDARFEASKMPCWIDISARAYGFPDLESRGFKVALDPHGPEIDPDTEVRSPTERGIAAARAYMAQRFPALADAPLLETRVCQYENTESGDYLIDRHPIHANVWIAGGGSGHGFKHGPAVGEYLADLIQGKRKPDPRFSLESKPEMASRSHGSSFYRQ